jgi:hypothetical protein
MGNDERGRGGVVIDIGTDLPTDDKLDVLLQALVDLAGEIEDIHYCLDEILEKLENLSTPGVGYSVEES